MDTIVGKRGMDWIFQSNSLRLGSGKGIKEIYQIPLSDGFYLNYIIFNNISYISFVAKSKNSINFVLSRKIHFFHHLRNQGRMQIFVKITPEGFKSCFDTAKFQISPEISGNLPEFLKKV